MTDSHLTLIAIACAMILAIPALYALSKYISLPSPSLQQVTECAR